MNPNGKVPAIVDGDVRVFESGAVAVYLADQTGQLLAANGRDRYVALSWVFFNVGGTGPSSHSDNRSGQREDVPFTCRERR